MANKESRGEPTLTRRGFVGYALGLGAGIVTLVTGVPPIAALLAAPRQAPAHAFVEVGSIADIPVDVPTGLTFVAESADAFNVELLPHSVWAVKDSAGAVTVFSPVCTHLGCQVAWEARSQRFVCPCHNSVFTREGKVVSGPAPRGLDTLPSKVEKGVLSVQWVDYAPGTSAKIPM